MTKLVTIEDENRSIDITLSDSQWRMIIWEELDVKNRKYVARWPGPDAWRKGDISNEDTKRIRAWLVEHRISEGAITECLEKIEKLRNL